ncbi:DUF885 domain-containing protein [Sinomicrobium sp. M5D2P9]
MKNKLILIAGAVLVIVQSCKKEEKQKTENHPPIAQVFADYHEGSLKLDPLSATYAGDYRYNDLLPNYLSGAYRDSLETFYTSYKEKLNNYDKDSLTPNDQLSYDILEWECNMKLRDLKFPSYLMPVNQFYSLHLTVTQLASGAGAHPFKTVKDYNDWLKRADAFATWCDTAVIYMKRGMKEGYVLPVSLIKKVIPQIDGLANSEVEEHMFYKPIENFPAAFGEEDKDKLRKAYAGMISEKLIPAFKKMDTFIKEEYLPAGRKTSGISELPGGQDYYDHLIQQYTTTTLSAAEIHKLGLKEVERIASEMERVKNEVGFKGNLKSFFDYVRNKKELMPFDDPQEVIDNFGDIHETMQPQLDKLFDMVPRTAFEVRRTEAFREASASAEYHPGSLDGTRPGIFYVPVPDVKKYNMFSDEDLFLHEAIPGHHYQISLQQENDSLPMFRKTLFYSAYGEGWALYCESLGKELGLYTDPYQYFGMLSAEMHRAIRLVVDTGIHTKGWSREQAIRYSMENEAESEAGITSEIERYMAIPGQALSYKVGQLKILELRNRAEKALGDRFDIKEFHNKVLEPGCLPLQLLEERIDTWIQEQS